MRKVLFTFLVYWVITFLGSLFVQDILDLLGTDHESFFDFTVFWFAFGFILFLVLWFMVINMDKNHKARLGDLIRTNNEIKAQLYDREHPSEEPDPKDDKPSDAELKSKTK